MVSDESQEHRWWRWATIGAIAIGTVIRLAALARARPLNLDEAMLAVNVMGSRLADLLLPLGLDQAAPPLFLLALRGLGLLGHGHEVSLRLLPFLAGVAMMPLAWLCARRLTSAPAAGLGVLLIALSPSLIDHSVEVKPYILDGTLLLAGLWVALVIPGRGLLGWRWWALFASGFVVIVSSFTAPWTLTLAGVVLAARSRVERWEWRQARAMIGLGTCLLVAFGIVYATLYSSAGANEYLQEFWVGAFLRDSSPLLGLWTLAASLWDPVPLVTESFRMAILLPVGLLLLGSAYRAFGLAAVFPWGLCTALLIVASLFGLYPVGARLVLFLAPLTLMLLAAGSVGLLQVTRAPVPVQALALSGMVLAGSLWAWSGGRYMGFGATSNDPAMELVLGRPEGTPVYLLSAIGPRYLYYSTDWADLDASRLRWFVRTLSWGGDGFRDARAARGFSPADSLPLSPPGQGKELVAYASGAAHRQDEAPEPGWASAELARLLRTGYDDVMVFAGGHHRRELPPFLAEVGQRGLVWVEQYRAQHAVVGVLHLRQEARSDRLVP